MRMPNVRFTLRRMMVGVAIVAVVALATRMVADILEAREEANRQMFCRSNLAHLAVYLHQYRESNGAFPPGTFANSGLMPERRLGWGADLAPYICTVVDPGIDRTKGWEVPPNRTLTYTVMAGVGISWKPQDSFNCVCCPAAPAVQRAARPTPLSYVGVAGLGADAPDLPAGHPRAGVFGYDRSTRLSDILDGSGQTMMLAEASTDLGAWTAGGPTSVRGVDPAFRPHLGKGRRFGGSHVGGAYVAMADGSVKFVRESVDPKVFEAMSTIAGGEPVPSDWNR
jgi:hypothetical protein